jgi:hypothetical protein
MLDYLLLTFIYDKRIYTKLLTDPVGFFVAEGVGFAVGLEVVFAGSTFSALKPAFE